MVKEFEKSAAAYARATTSREGFDCTKLHTYKYNDDTVVTILPDGKNHGLVFDWSVLWVRLFLILSCSESYSFCRKVKIPFELYAFVNSFPVTMMIVGCL